MQKQKFAPVGAPKKRHLLDIGVFLLIIALMWLISFKLVGGGKFFSRGGSFFESLDRGGEASEPVFADPGDYPVMVMFDNHPDSISYLSGISSALVVYEVLAEGGSTRFAGVFAGAPEHTPKIGPIRSARPYVVDIASGWSAFFWHAGGSPEALELIPKTDVVDLNEISGLGIKYFWRDNEIPRPHNLFTSADLIALGIQDFELTALPGDKLVWQWEEPGAKIKKDPNAAFYKSIYIDFSEGVAFDASYEYEAQRDAYLRLMGGAAHKDNATGEQIAPANVIIQRVPAEGLYPSGYDRISLDMEGTGQMLLFQHGRVIRGTWKKGERDNQTEWLGPDGEPVVLAVGQTWVEVVPGARSVTYE